MIGWSTAGLALALATGCGRPGDEISPELRELATASTSLTPEETLLRCDALRAGHPGTAAESTLRRIEDDARARRRERDRDRDRDACVAEADRLGRSDPLHLLHSDRRALLEAAARLSNDPTDLKKQIAALNRDYRNLLVGHWVFAEALPDATTAEDRSAHAHHGLLRDGAGWTNEPGAKAIRMDGIDDCVELPTTPALSNLNHGSYTISTWFRPASLPGGMTVPPGVKPSDSHDQFGLVMRPGFHEGLAYSYEGRFIMYHWFQGEENAIAVTWDSFFPPGRFVHVTGVVDADRGIVSVYVNGRGDHTAEFPASASPRDYEDAPWRIGIGQVDTQVYPWPAAGLFRDVRFFARALTRDEVRRLYDHDRGRAPVEGALIGHWKLDEPRAEGPVRDSSPAAHHGYRRGDPQPTPGAIQGALRFDGEGDYVQLPNSVGLDTVEESDYTVTAWYRPDGTRDRGEVGIFMKGGGRFGLFYNGDGGYLMKHHLRDGTWAGAAASVEAPSTAQFRHVTGVVRRESGQTTLYVDGAPKAPNRWASGAPPMDSGVRSWKIGTVAPYSEDSTGCVRGTIDDVRIYRRALSDGEIKTLYDEGRPR